MATHTKNHEKNTGSTKELQYRNEKEGEAYALVTGFNGDARFKCTNLTSGQEVPVTAPGRLRHGPNKKKIKLGDTILIQQDSSCTGAIPKYWIIHVYSADHVKQLRKAGELAQIKDRDDDDETVAVVFGEDVPAQKQMPSLDEIEIDDDFISGV
jgi:hypothetical protein